VLPNARTEQGVLIVRLARRPHLERLNPGRMSSRVGGGRERVPTSEMAATSTQNDGLRTHLQEGAIYRDRFNNAIRLLSVRRDYCVYVYVSLPKLRSSMHGSVTGLTRRDAFGAHFVFVAGSVKDWIGNQRKHDALTDSFGIVPYLSFDSKPAQPHQCIDFPLLYSRHTITRRVSHG